MKHNRTKTLLDVAHEVLREYACDRGWPGLPKLFAKLCLLAVRYPAHRRWLRVIGGTTTKRILAIEPRTAFRHSSKYLFAGLPWRSRIALMSAHYAFLNRTYDASFFERVIAPGGVSLWERALDAERLSIVLLGPPHHREGDLRLHFKSNGTTVFKTAFSLVPGHFFLDGAAGEEVHDPLVLYIGQIQGAAGQLDAIRRATRCCNDIAPPDLLMSALAGLAETWRVRYFFSAGPAIHHSAQKLSRSQHPFDYGRFWERYHATLLSSGHYVIPLPFAQKSIVQIVARHRKRASIKRDFRSGVRAAVATRMAPYLIRSSLDSADGQL